MDRSDLQQSTEFSVYMRNAAQADPRLCRDVRQSLRVSSLMPNIKTGDAFRKSVASSLNATLPSLTTQQSEGTARRIEQSQNVSDSVTTMDPSPTRTIANDIDLQGLTMQRSDFRPSNAGLNASPNSYIRMSGAGYDNPAMQSRGQGAIGTTFASSQMPSSISMRTSLHNKVFNYSRPSGKIYSDTNLANLI